MSRGIMIDLDKPRKLVFDLNAMAHYESATGKSALAIGESTGATELRALLWACLIHEDEELSVSDVGKLINAQNMAIVAKALSSVISTSTATGELEEASKKN
jgi:hypothetical protein